MFPFVFFFLLLITVKNCVQNCITFRDKAKIAKLIREVDIILKSEVEKFVDPSTVFNRTYAKKDLVDNSDRQMVVYDGDYIEGSPSENVQNGSSLSKQWK